MNEVQKRLFAMRDEKYKVFHTKLIPTVNPDTIIGVRTPDLRKFGREFAKTPDAMEFIKVLPHTYYEENNLHACVIEQIKDYDNAIAQTQCFLPYIDNWATCDMFMPKVFRKNTDKLLDKINEWIASNKTYTIRYAIGLLMGLYLDSEFKTEYSDMVARVRSDEYYVNMMIAWYFATALVKQYDDIIGYITESRLDKWVHNKTIQKAVESNRIDDATKTYLRKFKIK